MTAVHEVVAGGLDELRAALMPLPDDDVVLALPAGRSWRGASDAEVLAASALFDGSLAVAMAPAVPAEVGVRLAALHDLLRDAAGQLPHRPTPAPPAMCGPVATARRLLRSLEAGDDLERFCDVLLRTDDDIALDTAGQIVRVLDGTGTDVVVAGGALRAGGERPVAVVGDPVAVAAVGREARTAVGDPVSDAVRLAIAPPRLRDGDLVVAAPEIVVLPLWSTELCAAVVRAAEAADAWSADPDDPVPGAEVSLAVVSPRLTDALEDDARRRIWPALRTIWPEVAPTAVHDAFVIRYEPGPTTSGLPLHHDVAQVSGSIRLNSGYEGGALRFPRQSWTSSGVDVGDLVAWPSLVTHPHAAEAVTRGAKYGLTIWFALPT